MGQRVHLVSMIGLLFVLPLSCGPSSTSDDDDAGSDAGDSGRSGTGGGTSNAGGRTAGSGGSSGGKAGSGGTGVAGDDGRGGSLTLPEAGHSFVNGGTFTGGSAGGSSVAGKGGTNTSGRGGGAGAGPVVGMLGASCTADADCDDPTLLCLHSNDLSDGSGPPGGLCTKACSTGTDCTRYGDAYCYAFTGGDTYCLQACTTGTAGSPKCQSRDDFACSLVGVLLGSASCTKNSDCESGELCDPGAGTCGSAVTGCVPQCAGDFQCKSGQFCDFSTGLCVSTKPSGLPLGAVCTPPVGNAADPCQGFCEAGSDPEQGTCSSLCELGPSFMGCGWDGTGTPDQACLFGTLVSPPGDAVTGDVGLCGALCDCNADCLRTGDFCVDESGGSIEAYLNRRGYCRPLDASETIADTFANCSSGAGGEGGAGAQGGAGG